MLTKALLQSIKIIPHSQHLIHIFYAKSVHFYNEALPFKWHIPTNSTFIIIEHEYLIFINNKNYPTTKFVQQTFPSPIIKSFVISVITR
jgi:hypothetical protein